MTKLKHFLPIAISNLLRGGQRVVIAVFVIAFGVMSLVSMTSVAELLSDRLLVSGAVDLGGDIKGTYAPTDYLYEEHIAQLEKLAQDGIIDTYVLLAENYAIAFRKPDSGTLLYASKFMGVEGDNYPLYGEISLSTPEMSLAQALTHEGDVAITIDLAQKHDFEIGDEIILSDSETGAVVAGHVAALIVDTPNHQGSQILYNLDTAARFVSASPLTHALIKTQDVDTAYNILWDAEWFVYTAEEYASGQAEVQQFINVAFRGAGILGLLVAGIGIANTMQVLLARRSKEVAIFKTMGYTERDMLMVFLSEAVFLGVLGSAVGLLFGIALSSGLVSLFSRLITILIIDIYLSAFTLVTGFLIGVVTTLIFSAYAIVRGGNVRPAVLLRNESIRMDALGWKKSLGLIAGLVIPFVLVTAYVMDSILFGIGVLLVAVIGLGVLGMVMWGLLFVFSRLIPKTRWAVLNLVRNNLRSRGIASLSAMIALFIGIVTLTLAAIVTETAQREMDEHRIEIDGSNLTVVSEVGMQASVEAAMRELGLSASGQGAITLVKNVAVADGPEAGRYQAAVLIGRDEPIDFIIDGEAWDAENEGVYVYGYSRIPVGTTMEVVLKDGTVITVPVIGTYQLDYYSPTLNSGFGLLMPTALLEEVAGVETVYTYFELPANELSETANMLGQMLPQATVIDHAAYFARYTDSYQNLFVLALAMAGLSILAGVLLIANTVSLALVNRRYELGVLKAVGYSRGTLMRSLLGEYASIGAISTLLGLVGVWLFVNVFALVNEQAGNLLHITPLTVVISVGLGVLLPLSFVFFVIRQPLRVSPIIVLQDRE